MEINRQLMRARGRGGPPGLFRERARECGPQRRGRARGRRARGHACHEDDRGSFRRAGAHGRAGHCARVLDSCAVFPF
jgi:hypothetical protein